MDTQARAGFPRRRSDIALLASVLVLYAGRALLLRFAEQPPELATSVFGDLGIPMFGAVVLSIVLATLAVRWSAPFAGAVRALVAAIAFMALAVYPTEGFHGNAWYALPGTLFASVSLVKNVRARRARTRGDRGPVNPVAAGATSIAAGVILALVVSVLLVVVLSFWSLDGSS